MTRMEPSGSSRIEAVGLLFFLVLSSGESTSHLSEILNQALIVLLGLCVPYQRRRVC
ncbi:MAG: hypothetical protein K5657_03930 [Desulfovibrio sp.]|nr:hypothetical protein [Desulfovibrio sp.]